MPEEKRSEFVVTDKRKFTSEGERREDTPREDKPAATADETAPQQQEAAGDGEKRGEMPPPPTAEEQEAGKDAYADSRTKFAASPLSGRAPQEFEMTFERLVSSLYMSGAMALGGMQDEGGKAMVDIMGARQTIDTLAILADKTKGNLTATEENLLQSCLFDLRMAYVQITNLIAQQGRGDNAPEQK